MVAVIDDRDFSWLGGRRTAGPAASVEHVLWTVTKDVRTASVLVRQHSHGQDLICLIGPDLLWSQVFRPGDGRDLGRVAADTLLGFQDHVQRSRAGGDGASVYRQYGVAMKSLITWCVAVALVCAPLPVEAAGKKLVGAALVVVGGGLVAGAFDWRVQCPMFYTKHTFQNSTTQCVYISTRGDSDVRAATTEVSLVRPALVYAGAAAVLTGVVLLMLPKRVTTVVDVSVTPPGVHASKTFGF